MGVSAPHAPLTCNAEYQMVRKALRVSSVRRLIDIMRLLRRKNSKTAYAARLQNSPITLSAR